MRHIWLRKAKNVGQLLLMYLIAFLLYRLLSKRFTVDKLRCLQKHDDKKTIKILDILKI